MYSPLQPLWLIVAVIPNLTFKKSSSRYQTVLGLVFLLTLPLVNPWVRGDGVGYYAYVRSLLIDGDLHFENEWLAANPTFLMSRVDASGHLKADQYTSRGYVANHFTVGPAILWAPFLVPVHLLVLTLDRLGAHLPADGYSRAYTLTMALATAFYGFLGLLLAFCLTRSYIEERWAFWATLGIWFASALPVYMYLNPSWSHAHSAFAVSLFFWYWHRTRQSRSLAQWTVWGGLSGLMLDIYYPNGVFLMLPLLESLGRYWRAWSMPPRDWRSLRQLFGGNIVYIVAVVVAFLPTLATRAIIYGNPLQLDYGSVWTWNWKRPALWAVLFSSDHGLLSWTPILALALIGLAFLWRYDAELARACGLSFLAYYYLIASYPVWDGISSFGNRFFVSLTPLFVLGLSCFFQTSAQAVKSRPRALAAVPGLVTFLAAWNFAFIFQWGSMMIPNRGPICWREMVQNQAAVPARVVGMSKEYFLRRSRLMEKIEGEDARRLRSEQISRGKREE